MYASTFHSVYISTRDPSAGEAAMEVLYIPLCLYQYALPLDRNGWHAGDSTFHSVYISTKYKQYNMPDAYISTFHSVYISTRQSRLTYPVEINSTFHSVYISTLIVRTLSFSLTHSTFHSVYISTHFWRIKSRTLLLLYIPLCLYQYDVATILPK